MPPLAGNVLAEEKPLLLLLAALHMHRREAFLLLGEALRLRRRGPLEIGPDGAAREQRHAAEKDGTAPARPRGRNRHQRTLHRLRDVRNYASTATPMHACASERRTKLGTNGIITVSGLDPEERIRSPAAI